MSKLDGGRQAKTADHPMDKGSHMGQDPGGNCSSSSDMVKEEEFCPLTGCEYRLHFVVFGLLFLWTEARVALRQVYALKEGGVRNSPVF